MKHKLGWKEKAQTHLKPACGRGNVETCAVWNEAQRQRATATSELRLISHQLKRQRSRQGSGGKEQRDRITRRDEEGRREGCCVNVWNESSGGRGECATEAQSEQGKTFFVLFCFTGKRLTRTSRLLQSLLRFFWWGVSRSLSGWKRNCCKLGH